MHDFVVVENLVASVIFGVDFLHAYALMLDFCTSPVNIHHAQPQKLQVKQELLPVYESACQARVNVCAVVTIVTSHVNIVDECAVPMFGDAIKYELPTVSKS